MNRSAFDTPNARNDTKRFFLGAFLCVAILFTTTRNLPSLPYFAAMLTIIMLSAPLAIYGMYQLTCRKLLTVHQSKSSGILFQLIRGRTIGYLVRALLALAASIILVLEIHSFGISEWLLVVTAVPVYWVVHSFFSKRFTQEFRTPFAEKYTLMWSSAVTALLIFLCFICIGLLLPPTPTTGSLAAQPELGQTVSGSYFINIGVETKSLAEDAILALATNRENGFAKVVLAYYYGGALVTFFSICWIFGVCTIPAREYRRIFGPLSSGPTPPPLPISSYVLAIFMGTLVLLIAKAPLAVIEQIAANSWRTGMFAQLNDRAVVIVERIGNGHYTSGTTQAVNSLKLETITKFDDGTIRLLPAASSAFEKLKENVDRYLDWHYSLGGEYGRLYNLASGNIDTYMADKLEEHLNHGEPFAQFESELNASMSQYNAANEQYQQRLKQLLAEREITTDQRFVIMSHMSSAFVNDLTAGHTFTGIVRDKLEAGYTTAAGAGLGGVVGAVVATKIAGKVAGKGILKIAAKSVTKIVASKAASAGGVGAGASAGAAMGSIVPGVGTAIGAGVGAFIGGTALSLSVDKAAIEAEELFDRETLKTEILQAISDERDQFFAMFSLSNSA